MKANALFTPEWQKQLKSSLVSLDIERKKTVKKILSSLLPFCLISLLVSSFLSYQWILLILREFKTSSQDDEILWVGLVGCIFIMAPFIWLFFVRRKSAYRKYVYEGEYFKKYKHEVVVKILQQMDQSFVYSPQQGISEQLFSNSGFPLFANPTAYYAQDSIFGEIGKTNIQFGEVLAEQTIEDEDSKQVADLFRGLFFVADLHKSTHWETIVYPDVVKYFSKMLFGKYSEEESFRKKKYQRVKLEDPEFERYFEVYGTDQVESRYILSPALMARLVDFKRKTKKDIQISFKESKIYFAIYYTARKPLFKPPVFGTIYNLKTVANYITELQLMINIVKELNLNSKIE